MEQDTVDMRPLLNAALARIIAARGHAVSAEADAVDLPEFGLKVAVVGVWDNPDSPPPGEMRTGGVHIGFRCPALLDQDAFEFSYGAGATDEEACEAALEKWATYDLPVLLEAASGTAKECVLVEMRPDRTKDATWRIYLGPLHYMSAGAEEPCCQTCLFVMSAPHLASIIDGGRSAAVKIVASKSGDGETSADCRLNGDDMPEAIRGVAEAAADWEVEDGLHMRRQYIFFRAPGAG